jgi:PIN domain nuclease of toxin-antitoxin system
LSLLIDAHALLWWSAGDPRLSHRVRDTIGRPDAIVFISAVTAWEIAIKVSLGRLDPGPCRSVGEFMTVLLADGRFRELPVSIRHATAVEQLPPHHQDPFDRMLVAQARLDGLTIATRDAAIRQYDVAVMW